MNELKVRDLLSVDPLDDAFRNFLRPWASRGHAQVPDIKLDLIESDGDYTLKADLPGVRKEEIQIDIDENKVSIAAEVKRASEEKKGDRLIRSERHYGYASRSIWLENPVDQSKSRAKYENGVLEVTLPKKTVSTAKRLMIA